MEVAGQVGTYREMTFSIEVGVPKLLADEKTYITKMNAARSAAYVANIVAIEVGMGFHKAMYKPGSESVIQKTFAKLMEAQLQLAIPGARVTTVLSGSVQSHPAVWEKSWWQKLLGN